MLLAAGLFLAALALLVAVFAVRKPKPLRRPDLANNETALRRAQSIRTDGLDDIPTIGGANQARMAKKRLATRTGTIYAPPSEPTPTPTPTDPDLGLANVIQMTSIASATTPEHHHQHHAPAPVEHCAPADTSSHHDHAPAVDSHCHTSSSDFGGGGFDGGGGGHHGH